MWVDVTTDMGVCGDDDGRRRTKWVHSTDEIQRRRYDESAEIHDTLMCQIQYDGIEN